MIGIPFYKSNETYLAVPFHLRDGWVLCLLCAGGSSVGSDRSPLVLPENGNAKILWSAGDVCVGECTFPRMRKVGVAYPFCPFIRSFTHSLVRSLSFFVNFFSGGLSKRLQSYRGTFIVLFVVVEHDF